MWDFCLNRRPNNDDITYSSNAVLDRADLSRGEILALLRVSLRQGMNVIDDTIKYR